MGGQFQYRLVGLGGYPLLRGEGVDAVDVGIGLGYFASIRSLALKSFQRSTLGTQYRLEVIFHSFLPVADACYRNGSVLKEESASGPY